MTTTYILLRQHLCERLNDWFSSTCSSNGTSTKKDIIDIALADKRQEPVAGQYVFYLGAANVGEVRRAEGYADSTNTLSVTRAFTAATVSGEAYELHAFHPDDIEDAINAARMDIYPWVYNEIWDSTMTSRKNQYRYTLPTTLKGGPFEVYLGRWASIDIDDQLLDNGDFEEWDSTSAATDWDTPTEITCATESTWVHAGTYSCKCTATTSAGSLYQTVSTYADYSGQRMSFSIWVYCMTADRIKAAIYDSAATESTNYHEGKGWEQLTVSYTMPSAPSAMKPGVTVAAGTVLDFYVDDAVLRSAQRVADKLGDPLYNWKPPFNGIIEFPYALDPGRPITVKGMGHLTEMIAETTPMEIDEPQTELLYAQAAVYLYRQILAKSPGQAQQSYLQLLAFWENEVNKLRGRVAMGIPPMLRIAPSWGL